MRHSEFGKGFDLTKRAFLALQMRNLARNFLVGCDGVIGGQRIKDWKYNIHQIGHI